METITDARGRQIDVELLDTLKRRRFLRNMGAAADVQVWLGEALVAAQARSIDGVPVVLPATPDQADALVARLDADGINAIAEWLQGKAEARLSGADAAKNSPGTPTS